MATRPKHARGARGRRSGSASASAADPRDRIIDALMALTAERGYWAVGLADIAAEARVTLAELRDLFPGRLAILAAFSRRIDDAVLAGGPAEGEGARDRLFDIFMRRLDALAPHKPALRRLAKAARCSPGLAGAVHCIAASSQKWMLAAAGIHRGGLPGIVATEGSILVLAETLRVWLDDDDPDLAKTMRTLDQALGRGERAMRLLDDVCGLVCRLVPPRRDRAEQRATG